MDRCQKAILFNIGKFQYAKNHSLRYYYLLLFPDFRPGKRFPSTVTKNGYGRYRHNPYRQGSHPKDTE